MSPTLLQLHKSGGQDELLSEINPDNVIDLNLTELEELYMNADWTEDSLSKVTSTRIDHPGAVTIDVPMIIGVASKLGFLDIIRILVYRSGFKPEGRYFTFDFKHTLSALETAVVFGRLDSIDLLVQCGTKNEFGESSNLTIFEYAYMSRQLGSMKRLVFWSEKLSTGICSGDSWVRVNFRMLLGMDRQELRIFSESSDSLIPRNSEKEIRLYMLNLLENDIFQK